ncbi:hypothetical protein BS78_09G046300 [Paspalum vaginatum]|nr:hypothetical protein BS78_09G046300 [Paspalum vaginatum]
MNSIAQKEICMNDENEVLANDEEIVPKEKEYIFPSPEEVENSIEPSVGMKFASLGEAHRYLNVHGLLNGYSTRKGTNYLKKTYHLECNRSGKGKKIDNAQRKRRRNYIERTGCKMKVTAKLIDGQWEFTKVDYKHNHETVKSPSLTKFFLNHKRMTEDERTFSKILQSARIKPKKIMAIFRELKGSFKQVSEESAKENPGFCYSLRMDDDNTVRSIFWTDARAKLDYELANMYNLPFAPIVGINGYGNNIIFGCALVQDQTSETFEWVFKTFKAIAEFMPDVIHRLCIWHIIRRVAEKCGSYIRNRKGMEKILNELVYDSVSIQEFEDGWQKMLKDFGTADNKHLEMIYKLRTTWVPVYFKNVLCPFIHSTSRSESTNSHFKDFVLPKDSIENFMHQYKIIQESAISKEDENRFRSMVKQTTFCTQQPIERQAARIYNRDIFVKFQTELYSSSAFSVKEIIKDHKYTLRKNHNYDNPEFLKDSFNIEFNRIKNEFICECSKLERDGLPCCHILRLFTQMCINELPEHCICKRWTKDYREQELEKQKKQCMEAIGSDEAKKAIGYALVMNKVSSIWTDVCNSASDSKEFLEELEKFHEYWEKGNQEKMET